MMKKHDKKGLKATQVHRLIGSPLSWAPAFFTSLFLRPKLKVLSTSYITLCGIKKRKT